VRSVVGESSDGCRWYSNARLIAEIHVHVEAGRGAGRENAPTVHEPVGAGRIGHHEVAIIRRAVARKP
jgi:hypothetical protein